MIFSTHVLNTECFHVCVQCTLRSEQNSIFVDRNWSKVKINITEDSQLNTLLKPQLCFFLWTMVLYSD